MKEILKELAPIGAVISINSNYMRYKYIRSIVDKIASMFAILFTIASVFLFICGIAELPYDDKPLTMACVYTMLLSILCLTIILLIKDEIYRFRN